MANPEKSKLHQVPVNHAPNGLHHIQPAGETHFLSGLKQRLLSFIFQGIWNEETDPSMVRHMNIKIIALRKFSF